MGEGNGTVVRRSLLFAWSPRGYRLRELEGDPPRVGSELEDDGQLLTVIKVGPSPLPGDERLCAYTIGR